MTATDFGRAVGPLRLATLAGVTIKDGRLRFRGPWSTRHTPTDLLVRFIKACDTTDDGLIVDFARAFGPLLLCAEDELPRSHKIHGFPLPPGATSIYVHEWANDEPLERWRAIAGQLAAVRRVATALRQDERVSALDWNAATSGPIPIGLLREIPKGREGTREQRRQVAQVVRAFIACADLRPGLVWEGTEPEPHVEYRGALFAALAHQLMGHVLGGADLLLCVVCGREYPAERAPRPGERHYCPDHQTVRGRVTMRETRRRRRALQMSSQDRPLEEIAEALGVDTDAARGYIERGRELADRQGRARRGRRTR